MTRRLILVHGLGLKCEEESYTEIALGVARDALVRDAPHLVSRFDAVDKRVAFYGDVNRELRRRERNGQVEPERLSAAVIEREYRRRRRQLARRESDDFSKRHYTRLRDRLRTRLFAKLIHTFTGMLGYTGGERYWIRSQGPEAAEYWDLRSEYRATVCDRLRVHLKPALHAREDVLLVSHSMGSLIAHDVLAEFTRDEIADAQLSLWLTLGSPIGSSIAQRYLEPWTQSPNRPTPKLVRTWANIAAYDDLVCIDSRIANDFRRLIHEGFVDSIVDMDPIWNIARAEREPNPHSMFGYLSHPATVRLLGEWLERSS